MKVKIGTDLCDPARIEKVFRRYGKKFVTRILTQEEIEILEFGFNHKSFTPSLSHRLAARYAAKEAAVKVLGTGISEDVGFHDIQILKSPNGAPQIKLLNKAKKIADEQGLASWEISISHEKKMSIAVVVAYGSEKS